MSARQKCYGRAAVSVKPAREVARFRKVPKSLTRVVGKHALMRRLRQLGSAAFRRWCGSLGVPRGPGFATATTSVAFFPRTASSAGAARRGARRVPAEDPLPGRVDGRLGKRTRARRIHDSVVDEEESGEPPLRPLRRRRAASGASRCRVNCANLQLVGGTGIAGRRFGTKPQRCSAVKDRVDARQDELQAPRFVAPAPRRFAVCTTNALQCNALWNHNSRCVSRQN